MESIVLMDEDRIRDMGVTMTFYREEGCIVWWGGAFKFLVINDTYTVGEDMLVIGPINAHSRLYAVYRLWNELIVDESKVETLSDAQFGWPKDPAVLGAGRIGCDHQINSWESECFHVETPIDMRTDIEREVARLFKSGSLTPR